MISMKKHLLIGPVGSGKTQLIRSLKVALSSGSPVVDEIIARNEETQSLFDKGTATPDNPNPAATGGLQKYWFDVSLGLGEGPEPTGRSRLISSFLVTDSPGGFLFADSSLPDFDSRSRDNVIKELASVHGLVLCFDANNDANTHIFSSTLQRVYTAVRGGRTLERLAICLTKAEKHVKTKGPHARDGLKDPRPRLSEIVGRQGVTELRNLQKPELGVEVGIAWVSTFGFRDDGSANCTDDDRLASGSGSPASKAIDLWRPYQVIDPIVFLAAGDRASHQVEPL